MGKERTPSPSSPSPKFTLFPKKCQKELSKANVNGLALIWNANLTTPCPALTNPVCRLLVFPMVKNLENFVDPIIDLRYNHKI
jgi:hypothetical protein